MYRPRQRTKYTKRRSNRIKYILLISGGVLVVALIAFLIFLLPQASVDDSIVSMPFSAENVYAVSSQGVAYIQNDKYTLLDKSFSPVWTNNLVSLNMAIESSDSLFAAYNATNLQAFDKTGLVLYTKGAPTPIRKVRLGTTRAAYLCDSTGAEGPSIYIVDESGNDMAAYAPSQASANIVDFGFYGKTEMMWVLMLDASGTVPMSTVITYNPGRAALNSTQSLSQIVEKVLVDDEFIYSCGTTNISITPLLSGDSDSILVYGWRYLSHTFINDKPLFVYVPRSADASGGFNTVKLISTDKTSVSSNLPESCFAATVHNSKLYCLSKSKIYVYSLGGAYEKTIALPVAYDSVLEAKDGVALFQKGSEIYALPLP